MERKPETRSEQRRRLLRRQRFAEHVEHEMRRLNTLEEWREYRFTELEAEVEAEGRYRRGWLPWQKPTRSGLHRERSLSKAITNSTERLILLEGVPGSGKSVALRHVALSMAQMAMENNELDTVIPIYINLKALGREQLGLKPLADRWPVKIQMQLRQLLVEFFSEEELRTLCFDLGIDYEALSSGPKPSKARELVSYCLKRGRFGELLHRCREERPLLAWEALETGRKQDESVIDRNLIYAFVLKTLNRANDRDIELFLEEEFNRGLKNGTWFFLFDSFDELPDVLSSTEADDIIRQYADAISDFLHGMNHCRGVIASRNFRGPRRSDWAQFRILPLSDERRLEMINRADLPEAVEQDLRAQLGMATSEVREMVKNPLFLGLLCEHMRDGRSFPTNTHTVFETYVENRLQRDEDRLQQRFGLPSTAIRQTAETIAFAMAADIGLGLNPTRNRLRAALTALDLPVNDQWETELDALEFIKLARAETENTAGESRSFTFAHRRFQEYFATCIVLRTPDVVTPQQLLANARWRETAVTLCQTQPVAGLTPLFAEIRAQLATMIDSVPELVDDGEAAATADVEDTADRPLPTPFSWPPGVLHLLDLLQSGFGARLDDVPDDIRRDAGRLLFTAVYHGTLYDRKWALEVAGIAPTPVLLWLLRKAFSGSSTWVADVAFRQVARLPQIPDDVAGMIRMVLLRLFRDGRERRDYLSIQAYLARLDKPKRFLDSWQLLTWIRPADNLFHLLIVVLTLIVLLPQQAEFAAVDQSNLWYVLFFFFMTVFLVSRLSLRTISMVASSSTTQIQQASFFTVIGLFTRLLIDPLFAFIVNVPFSAAYLLLLWPTFALFAVRTGDLISLPARPFIFAWPIVSAGRNLANIGRGIFRTFAQNWKTWLILGFVYALLVTSGVTLINSASDQIIEAPPVFWLALIFVTIMLVGGLLFVLFFALWPMIGGIGHWSLDLLNWLRWQRQTHTELTIEEFSIKLSAFYHGTYRLRWLRRVRQHGLLLATSEVEPMLQGLAIALEQALQSREQLLGQQWKKLQSGAQPGIAQIRQNLQANKLTFFGLRLKGDAIYQKLRERPKPASAQDIAKLWEETHMMAPSSSLWVVGNEFLDELYRLISHLEGQQNR